MMRHVALYSRGLSDNVCVAVVQAHLSEDGTCRRDDRHDLQFSSQTMKPAQHNCPRNTLLFAHDSISANDNITSGMNVAMPQAV